MRLLRRKIDEYLVSWKNSKEKSPLIVKGARQIGKTVSIEQFAKDNYENVIEINFALQNQYKSIFDDGFEVDTIINNISFINPSFKFVEKKTLIFFDEIQDCINCATSLKAFKLDGRFDVICSGSMMGINYQKIESNSVGHKIDYEMYSLDFEEFLWAKGYNDNQINDLLDKMINLEPLSNIQMDVLIKIFREYMVIGGMPAVVSKYIENDNFSGTLELQKQLLLDYEEDITKYAAGLDKYKILSVYRKIAVFLGKENKKFQITKVEKNARSREYIGVVEWLKDASIVNICHCINQLELPIKGNYNPNYYKMYFADTGLLIASLDEEAQTDLRMNKNFNIYKGAVYENIIADMLNKQGYDLVFYQNIRSALEMDFFIRDKDYLIPLEVKASDNSSKSLNKLIENDKYKDIKYGIKLCNKNIGYNGKFYTFPYFLTFLLKRYINKKSLQASK